MPDLDAHRRMFSLDGKVALVPGGAGGIGTQICEALAAQGAVVVATSRSAESAEKLAASIVAAGGDAHGIGLDPLETATIGPAVDAVVADHGSVDILVNCIGSHIEAPAVDYTEADWDRIFDINLKSAFFLSQAVARHQIALHSREPGRSGKHIHLSSVRSMLGLRRGYVSYCTTKGGLNLMVKQLATEWGRYNIQVNAVAPTFTRTDLVKDYLEDPAFYEPLVARIPLGRICEPEEVAAATVYFASPGADFVTGQVLYLDGGITSSQ